ncbi:transcriptional repressor for multidrug efflux pump (TetR/AcrR family) [Xenorhabdus nematophila ATCC 19061]|uniref:Transcriptional repressor for multidrug efflux pump (TetR/AcrR family) n=2 Tax=Xenorhabdus nematophila TaxID=628 RepID=D3VL71_XENNA|nr:DNA-binding transcriptional repressor AcrR [Xenorhabdus nematophila]CBJ89030.1 transcriptional repressor for multidrug efflux pump (TetR/AcrR family) [Xenorhabdus nematophila ATCC 19061]CEF30616.1 transcriptional repressor for multidrug efflux pump (TetR/AcrR family) [Xenorhabdus nematophila str. Websteri]CEF31295.1 transcriptional repressor for multidrug efflux pump (TetR/AcrR family) [Xenorhabdus nematophila str. Websteri]CEK21940.1 transcriptional repressor for multidrug efflux pump (TetR
MNVCKSASVKNKVYGIKMARKTKQQAKQTRQQIIDAAIKTFSERGVSATSLSDIAIAAGVTRGAIYWHFKNKTDLLSTVCKMPEDKIGALEREYQAKYPNNPLLALRSLLIFMLRMMMHDTEYRLLIEIFFHKCEFVGEISSLEDELRETCISDYEKIEKWLACCIQSGELPHNLELRRAAIMLKALMTGLLENWSFSPDSFNVQEQSAYLVDGFIDTLKHSDYLRYSEENEY